MRVVGHLADEGGLRKLGAGKELPRQGQGAAVNQLGGGDARVFARCRSEAEHDPEQVGGPVRAG